MMPGSERTLCIPGGASLLYLFSYEEVSLSSNFGNIKYSVNGIDSSIFRFIESFFDSWSRFCLSFSLHLVFGCSATVYFTIIINEDLTCRSSSCLPTDELA